MRKICVITGTRAEYGLLYWLMKEIEADKDLKLQIITTGMHLSPEFGLTYKEIEKDFKINKKIEILLSSDTPVGISKSMGLAQISFSESFEDLKPDIIVVLGDRFEIFSAVSAAMIARIPVAHLHGGETTEGAFDEAIRHSITKMSHFHFVAAEPYRRRVIQLGESPERVMNYGAPGLDNIKRLKFLNRDNFESAINFKLGELTFIVTYHPVTLNKEEVKPSVLSLFDALKQFPDAKIIFTKSNADTNGRIINKLIDNFVSKNSKRSVVYTSLGQLRYLSALKHVDVVIGNSSSGIIEAPAFKKPTVNIGDRQRGRLRAASVIDCNEDSQSIVVAIKKALSPMFQETLKTVKSLYGYGDASRKMKEYLKKVDLRNILKKKFYDL